MRLECVYEHMYAFAREYFAIRKGQQSHLQMTERDTRDVAAQELSGSVLHSVPSIPS